MRVSFGWLRTSLPGGFQSLPKSKMKLVQAWIEIHRDNLLANWKPAVEGQQPFKIEPLR
jgi:hypothetical protein